MCSCNKPKPCGCVIQPMGCKDKDISTDCITYTGDSLLCSGIQKDTILTDVIKQLDSFICDKFSEQTGFLTIENIGTGVGIYKGNGNQGQKQLKTLVSSSSDLNIVNTGDTITFSVAPKGADIYTISSSLNSGTGVATFLRSDSNTYALDLSAIVQVQSNILETNTSSKAFIQNQNPTKTISTNYTLTAGDNNYVIEVNNTTNNVVITIPGGLPANNFFVGFIQKGTGTVTFTGFDTKPVDYSPVIYGQGHNAALEIIGGNRYIFGNLADA